ncbi:copper resistance protein CopD [Paraburkholderia ginsengiterrae]|uniref:Copper resistance protein CopD n=1 Tax=Paraburkholderia ginsengiterrae TaxID=1462993 RepID=A0A1A9NF46_9BURK|nr:CopD family protein [Paraburkholderia ginsengiterrae]OAJ58392.1 copper resistance protein CopD [Paraburkholderia ginsengiterrae]OAJ65612.1 copper resistance protein CopD [Paraburkholderia ginsengiterrae]
MSVDGLWIGQVAMAALMNVAFAFAVGSALLGAWLAKDAQTKISPARPAWLRAQRLMLTATVVLVLADLGWLLYQAASMSGVTLPAAIGVVPTVLTQTHVGYGWSLAFAGALVLLGTAMSSSHTGMLRNALLWLAVVAVAAGKASLGHAADAGPASAAIAMQTLHVLVTSVWGGLALAAGLTVLPALSTSTARGMLIRTAIQVSNVSIVAVALVLVSGIFNGVRGSGGSFAAIELSTWGHVLTLKLALVGLALVLGGLNRFSALPRLRRTASTMDAHTFVNVLYLEALAMLGVFVAAAVLSHSVPGFAALG